MTVNISVNIEDTKMLNEKEAIKSLDKYIKNLKKDKTDVLTEKQVHSRIEIAKILRKAFSQLR